MKLQKIFALSLSALTLLTAPFAHATRTYSSGNVYLGFSQTGNTTSDFAVNVGAASTFRDALTPVTLTLTSLTTTLNSIFGAGWATNGALNVQWTLFGTTQNAAANGDPIRVLYSTKPTGDSAPLQQGTQTGTATNMLNAVDYYSNGLALGTISNTTESSVNNGTIGAPGNGNSITTRVITGSPFGTTNLNQAYAPVATSTLDFWRIPQGTLQTTVTNEGVFTIVGDTLTFTPVPEPSSMALSALALGGFGLLLRKRAKAAAASS